MIKKISKYLFLIIVSVFIANYPISVFAADPKIGETSYLDLQRFLNGIKTYLLSFIGALAVLVIVFSGLQYITSAGDPEKAKIAKKTLTYAIFGLIFIILAQVVLALLTGSMGNIFGTGVHNV